MTMQITWKTDGPLMLQGQLVGGSAKCCCKNPPPPSCVNCHSEWCAYAMEITAPSAMAVKAYASECGYGPQKISKTLPLQIDPGYASPLLPYTSTTVKTNEANDLVSSLYSVSNVFVEHRGAWVASGVQVDARIEALVFCTDNDDAPFSVRIRTFAYAKTGSSWWDYDSYQVQTQGIFPLPSECVRDLRRFCQPQYVPKGWFFKTLITPIEFTADGYTTSLGAYTSVQAYGTPGGTAAGIVAAIRGQLETTFRITSRSSCKPVECELTAIDGLIVTLGGFEFTLGTPSIQSVSEDPYVDTYEYLGGEGTAATPHSFVFTRYFSDGPFTSALDIQSFQMWLGSDNTVQPPVSRWYLIRLRTCVTVNDSYEITGSLSDRWTGHFGCYEAACGSGEVEVNQGIPDSEPFMARDPGYPLVTGVSCEQGFKSFGIRQNCGG